MTRKNKNHLDTWAAQAGHMIDKGSGAVVPPMITAATYARDEDYELRSGYMYARYGAPTTEQAEAIIAGLEDAEASLLFNSGLSALLAVIETLPVKAQILVPKVMYFGALAWLQRQEQRGQITLKYYEPGDIGTLKQSASQDTDLIWVETPANPSWQITDIAEAAQIAKQYGAKLLVDGTCAAPITTQALHLGADYSFHSATKYLNGHSDITGGVISVKEKTPEWADMAEVRKLQGTILPGFESWLLIRGLRTLSVRWDKACANAMALATYFENHPKIDRVLYPGLSKDPYHQIARKQMRRGFGGMLSLLVKGDAKAAKDVAKRTKIFIPATSLGGVESLIEHRQTIEGGKTDVAPNLIRLSVGIENVDDLINDIENAVLAI